MPLERRINELLTTTQTMITRIEELTGRLTLAEEVTDNVEKTQAAIEKTQRRHRWVLVGTAISLVVDVALTLFLLHGSVQIAANSNRINAVQERTSDAVLCPLYAIFVKSIKHPDPSQVDTPAKRKAFNAAAKVILTGYQTLNCPAD